MLDDANAKNIRALAAAAELDRRRVDELEARCRELGTSVANLTTELSALRVQVFMLLARSGPGPTQR